MTLTHQLTTLDSIHGTTFLAVHSAITTLQCHNMDIANFKIMVARDKTSIAVVFTDEEGRSNTQKTFGVRLGSDVEMDAHELNALLSNMAHHKVLDTFQGTNFHPIHAATTVFQQRKLDIEYYNITLMRDGNTLIVLFIDKDGKPGVLGNSGPRLGFEVELDSHDMSVLKSHFIR